jgi:hypothetical protein
LRTSDAEQVGFQVHHISTDVAYFCATDQAERITAFAGAFEFGGHLCVGKHAGGLLVANSGAVCGADAIPGAIPWRSCA